MQRAAIVIVVGAASALALLWLAQRSLIYFPARQLGPMPPGAQEATLATADGLELRAWFFPSGEDRGPAVIVFNGNAGNRTHRVPLAHALRDRGWTVLLVDYRGYGGNPGRPTERGLAADAIAAVDWLAARDEVDPDRIAYFGESLGAGVATGLAIERPPAALVLRSPFASLADMAAAHYPVLPARALLRDRFPVLEQIPAYGGPLLVVSGDADRIVPPRQSAAVARAVPDARHMVIPGADHNDPALLDGQQLIDAVAEFLSARM